MSTIGDLYVDLVRGFAILQKARFGWSQLLFSVVCVIWDAVLSISEMRMIGDNYSYKMLFSHETLPANKKWILSGTKPLFQIFTHFVF